MRKAALSLATVMTLNLTGCAVSSHEESLAMNVPTKWTIPTDAAATPPSADWWRRFGSSELEELIITAADTNLDLAAAIARVQQAEAQARIAGASLFPTVDLNGSVARQDALYYEEGSNTVTRNENSGENSYTALLTAGYEVDFWGKNRAAQYAGEALLRASRYDRDTVALTITAAISTLYFEVLSLRERLGVARLNLANAEAVLRLVEARVRAGTALALDLAQQRSVVATQRALLPSLIQQERETRIALAFLLGRPPQNFDIHTNTLAAILLPAVAPGLPSDLLTRRPDIKEAEAKLQAADADIVAARAAMLPSVQLTSSTGLQSVALSAFTSGMSSLYILAAGFTQPLFRGGVLSGQRDFALATRRELLQTYRATVLTAFGDVEIALGRIESVVEQHQQQTLVVEQAQIAFTLAQAQYRAGATDLLAVFTTQQTLYQSQDVLVQVRLAHLQGLIALFKALGGGWEDPGDGTHS